MLPAELSPSLAVRLGMEVADDAVEAKGGPAKANGSITQAVDPTIHPPTKTHSQQGVKISENTKVHLEVMTHQPDNPIIIPILVR